MYDRGDALETLIIKYLLLSICRFDRLKALVLPCFGISLNINNFSNASALYIKTPYLHPATSGHRHRDIRRHPS